jgi:hypothetical protein
MACEFEPPKPVLRRIAGAVCGCALDGSDLRCKVHQGQGRAGQGAETRRLAPRRAVAPFAIRAQH